jgi:hypothetical protein
LFPDLHDPYFENKLGILDNCQNVQPHKRHVLFLIYAFHWYSFVGTKNDAPLIVGAQEGVAHPTTEKGEF